MPVGYIIRKARERRRYSLRALARELRIAPSYLSDIERDLRNPTEKVLWGISATLCMDFDLLMRLAGRIPESVKRYLLKEELASQIMRRMAEAHFDRKDLEMVLQVIDEAIRREARRGTESKDG